MSYNKPPQIPERLVTGPALPFDPPLPETPPAGPEVFYSGYDVVDTSPKDVLSPTDYTWAQGPTLLDWEGNKGPPIELPAPNYSSSDVLPGDPEERNAIPLCSGVLDYFPAALVEVAKASQAGNDQHNPGEPLHWARGKSMDHSNKLLRHLVDRGSFDNDGIRHSAKMAWRALALLQMELEANGAPLSRASR